MSTSMQERRAFQRLALEKPILGSFADLEVQIIELGVLGARLAVPEPVEQGRTGVLSFTAGEQPVKIESEVVRMAAPFPAPEGQVVIPHVGVRFSRVLSDDDEVLRSLLRGIVRARLQELRSEVSAFTRKIDTDETLRPKMTGFVTYYMEDGEWFRRSTMLPDQPRAGFTVPADFDIVELSQLRDAYEEADTEGMNLIRLFAELSVAEALKRQASS